MNKICILFSGHLRNITDHINNFKSNLLDILIKNKYEVDIYMHTWDSNITNDIIDNNDEFYKNNDICDIINKIKNEITIKKILIESQKTVKLDNNVTNYITRIIKNKTIHLNNNKDYVFDLTNKLYFQYYGQYKSLQMIDNIDNYDYIIKTRPDVYYTETFDIKLLNHNIVFPNSHRGNNTSINNIFYFGKREFMIKILNYFKTINDIESLKNILNKYHSTDINFNCVFKYFIIDHLKSCPHYTVYNPSIYRNNKNIIKIN